MNDARTTKEKTLEELTSSCFELTSSGAGQFNASEGNVRIFRCCVWFVESFGNFSNIDQFHTKLKKIH